MRAYGSLHQATGSYSAYQKENIMPRGPPLHVSPQQPRKLEPIRDMHHLCAPTVSCLIEGANESSRPLRRTGRSSRRTGSTNHLGVVETVTRPLLYRKTTQGLPHLPSVAGQMWAWGTLSLHASSPSTTLLACIFSSVACSTSAFHFKSVLVYMQHWATAYTPA